MNQNDNLLKDLLRRNRTGETIVHEEDIISDQTADKELVSLLVRAKTTRCHAEFSLSNVVEDRTYNSFVEWLNPVCLWSHYLQSCFWIGTEGRALDPAGSR